MQVSVDQVVHVIAVRDRVVAAARAVHVPWSVPCAFVRRSAPRRVLRAHLDSALIDVVAVHVMQVPIVQIVGVTVVGDGHVPAAGLVNMRMIRMRLVLAHRCPHVFGPSRLLGRMGGAPFVDRIAEVSIRKCAVDGAADDAGEPPPLSGASIAWSSALRIRSVTSTTRPHAPVAGSVGRNLVAPSAPQRLLRLQFRSRTDLTP